MKNILISLVLSLLFAFTIQAQEFFFLEADTISNSEYKTVTVDLTKIGRFDSILIGIVAIGEIDLDTLRIRGGVRTNVPQIRGADKDTLISVFEALEANVLTINNADGVGTIVEDAATITTTEAEGYTQLEILLWGAAAGNDATDETQMYILYMTVFRPVQYNQGF